MFQKRADEKCTLANKVAVVTGSTKGIGFAIARRLAQDGAHVVISSRKQQNVDHAVATLKEEGLSVTGTVCHVGKAEDRQHLVTAILNVNVKSPALLLSQLLPHMEKRGGSSVVLVSSLASYIPVVKLGAYNTSKTALLGLCRSLAVELAPKGIRVNCILPGITRTDFGLGEKSSVFPVTSSLLSFRLGEPEDCAGLVSFLCSSDASFITGENIFVAGFTPRV
ncbi:dehydrogenase/reductase SDR family member 2, mitochondrial-like isoform X2 [Chionomys nivalis]|uniref:dehydrogenase/reductase SDR family member 2, mitochondrial-like isoform X2 n=1 Tax=Chionomys nivalis TaxID=269649 RepID=UPI002592E112|nr:dehydrogenase/reductase SDR family member 2, mitochondrial-like isoform X2 [Chionomys nivalis]